MTIAHATSRGQLAMDMGNGFLCGSATPDESPVPWSGPPPASLSKAAAHASCLARRVGRQVAAEIR